MSQELHPIDDVTLSLDDYLNNQLFFKYGLSYQREVYFLIKKSEVSTDLVLKYLRISNAFWHSLCVITTASLTGVVNQKLTFAKIQEIAREAVMIIVGAYDGEGYIFWELSTK